jgi:hypothetical protein
MAYVKHYGEYLLRKVCKRNLTLALIGECLVAVGLGAVLSAKYSHLGYYITFSASITLFGFVLRSFMEWHDNNSTSYLTICIGTAAFLQTLFVLGLNTPLLPFAGWVTIAGYLLIVPELVEVCTPKKK